jgi:hypothetical protein
VKESKAETSVSAGNLLLVLADRADSLEKADSSILLDDAAITFSPPHIKNPKNDVAAPDTASSFTTPQRPTAPPSSDSTTAQRHKHTSMSFVDVVGSPARSHASSQAVAARVKQAFLAHSHVLESSAGQIVPNMESLTTEAANFLVSIFGAEDVEPVKHAYEDLSAFSSIGNSLKFMSLAEQTMPDGSFQFRLRYFAGLGPGSLKRDRGDDPSYKGDVLVSKGIRQFLTSVFNNPENAPIEDCVAKARSLYITAKSCPKAAKGKKKSSLLAALAQAQQEDQPQDEAEGEETIIACINFAKIADRGMFVNWLATSNETISMRKYGQALSLVCVEGLTWQRRNLALFLLKAAHLSVMMHLRFSNLLRDDYCILLQARTAASEHAARFYVQVGFDEGDIISSRTQLATAAFEDFPKLLDQAADSTSDYIHFIWESDDICLFKNSTGTFGKVRRRWIPQAFNTKFEEVTKQHSDSLFTFPFAFIRQHLLVIASQLDLFFLPFRDDCDLSDFIEPNEAFNHRMATYLNERDVEKVRSGWITDAGIDFFIRW